MVSFPGLSLPAPGAEEEVRDHRACDLVWFDSWHCHLGLHDSGLKLPLSASVSSLVNEIGSLALTASWISGGVQLFGSWKVVLMHQASSPAGEPTSKRLRWAR